MTNSVCCPYFFLISPGRMIPSSKINAWAARLQTAHADSSFASSRGGLAALRPGPSVSPPRVPRGADLGGGAQRGVPETQGRPHPHPNPPTSQPLRAFTRGSSAHRRCRTRVGWEVVAARGSQCPPHALLRQLSQAAVRTPSLRLGFRHPRLSVPTSRMLKGPSSAWGCLGAPHPPGFSRRSATSTSAHAGPPGGGPRSPSSRRPPYLS